MDEPMKIGMANYGVQLICGQWVLLFIYYAQVDHHLMIATIAPKLFMLQSSNHISLSRRNSGRSSIIVLVVMHNTQ
jgi:hypothetical protein